VPGKHREQQKNKEHNERKRRRATANATATATATAKFRAMMSTTTSMRGGDVTVTFTSLPPMKQKVCGPRAAAPPRSASALANSRWSHLRSMSGRLSREHVGGSALRSRSHHSSSPSRPLSPIHDHDERSTDQAAAAGRARGHASTSTSAGSSSGSRSRSCRTHGSHIYVCGHHDIVDSDSGGGNHNSKSTGGRVSGAASRLALRDQINAESHSPGSSPGSSPRPNRVSIARAAAGQTHVRGSHGHGHPPATDAKAKRNPSGLMGFNERLELVRQRHGFPRLARASHRACRAT